MDFETKRLTLHPMTVEELRWYADDPERLAARFSSPTWEEQPDFFKAIVRKQAERVLADPENAAWHTFYLIVEKATGCLAGSIDFKRPPADRTVEIGYGIDERFRGRGYATEAADGMCRRAFSSGLVDKIVAATEEDNPASDRVLAKAGFRFVRKDGISNWYERLKP
ncbi:MAG: GNAT family N-acetyltransferase [Candidatus Izemoplasmatales bacterium]